MEPIELKPYNHSRGVVLLNFRIRYLHYLQLIGVGEDHPPDSSWWGRLYLPAFLYADGADHNASQSLSARPD